MPIRTANLIIEVTIGDQTQYSTVKSDVLVNSDTLTVWDEHMFFEFKNLVSLSYDVIEGSNFIFSCFSRPKKPKNCKSASKYSTKAGSRMSSSDRRNSISRRSTSPITRR